MPRTFTRNTSGQLSAMTVITRTLSDNLGEVIDGIGDQLDEAEQAQIAIQAALDAEEAARIAAILDATIAAGADGLIIEVHNDPPHALSDGAQSLTPVQFEQLCNRIAEIAPLFGKLVARRS